MLRVCYSNRTEALLAALAQNLMDERVTLGPFSPTRLVVPNRNVETYVKLGLAQATGIAAHLHVGFLRQALCRIAEEALPDARAVDLRQVEADLLTLLHDDAFLSRPRLAPVRDYIEAAGRKPDALDRRRCQLAAVLAPLFDEYATSRPEMLTAWAEGRLSLADASDALFAETESWQSALWRALFAADGLVEKRSQRQGITWLPLPQLVARAEPMIVAAEPLHVFGLSYVSRGYHAMLARIARRQDVRLYTVNPCREFWEDLETVAENRRRLKKQGRAALFPSREEARQLGVGQDPFGLALEAENLALRLWGRPGRENVRLLNHLTEGDFEGRFQAHGPGAETLLHRLQDDMLDRVARTEPDPALRADGSITVLACPGLRRELEVVAAEIWRLVRADPTLRLHEIAVVVPEARRELYLSHVGAVFGESHDLPHNVVDLPLGGGHRLGQAAEMLLDLPLGSFTRREVLPLLTHPSVMGRFPEATATEWLRLCDELGIVHGADRGDHRGTYVERDLLSWDQGLRRLTLGALMTGPSSGDETPVTFGGESYLPAERPSDEEPAALAFALLARSLLEDARFARGEGGAPARRPLGEWVELIRGLFSYLVPADEEEASLHGRCLRALQEVEAVDLGETTVSYRVAATLARRALGALGDSRGQYLAQGVTVASFVPMRAIPFRAIFVLGLGHGVFPRQVPRGPLDLRAARRSPGDVTPREQDAYMFLETLICARDRMTLSYVARDELTGETLPASSLLLELREVLAGLLAPEELRGIFDDGPRIPLRRHHDETRLFALPLAQREREAEDLGAALRAALPTAPAALPMLRRGLRPPARAALEERLGLCGPPPRPAAAGPERLVVPLAALRQFLEDPLQGSARFRLRLREVEGDETLLERDNESFATGALERVRLLREAMTRALLADRSPAWQDLVRLYDELSLREELLGRGPTGLFRQAEREGHRAILRGWWEDLEAVAPLAELRPRLVRFGRSPEHAHGGEIVPPIVIEAEAPAVGGRGRRVRVELVGHTDLLISPPGSPTGSVVLVSRKTQDEVRRSRDRLRAFLDHLALSAAGLGGGPHRALVACSTGDGHTLARARFGALDPERARAYLALLVGEMLTGALDADGPTGVHDYLLPCEAVFQAPQGGQALVEAVERLRDNYFERSSATFSSVNGPIPEAVERHDPPSAEEATRMVASRFGLYFSLLQPDDAEETGPGAEGRW